VSLTEVLSVVALLLFAGFLAGSESAINSISRVFVEELEVKSSKSAAWVARVVKEPARYLNVILFVRNQQLSLLKLSLFYSNQLL